MADLNTKSNQHFFQFIMTTSNHKPYTFPENKISMKQGSRESAIKYTDFALGEFIKNAKTTLKNVGNKNNCRRTQYECSGKN